MTELTDSAAGAALALAARVHAGQARKGTDTPYLAHILGVAALVLEGGGDEDALVAALLHDTVEDGGDPATIRATIEREFGSRVLEIVNSLSDAAPEAGEEKGPWGERKYRYIAHVRETGDQQTQLVCLADKLHNLTATLADLEADGTVTWQKFSEPVASSHWWYYDALGKVFAEGPVAGNPLQVRYARALERLDELTDLPNIEKVGARLKANPRCTEEKYDDAGETSITFLSADAAERFRAARDRTES